MVTDLHAHEEEKTDAFAPFKPLPSESLGSLQNAVADRRLAGCRILREIGQGGFGVVYLAQDITLERQVAIKVLSAHLAAKRDILEIFLREARAAARLKHPNIIQVYAAGEEEGCHFIAMEYVEGMTLGQVLKKGPVDGRWACQILLEVARAVDFSHQKGLIHRDIKPSNVMVEYETDRPVVMDFGLAVPHPKEKSTDAVWGTPSYMSPEQVQGWSLDRRTDVYSLGVMLYELVTAHKPFESAHPSQVFKSIVEGFPLPPRQIQPSISKDLEAVILKAIQKDRDRRYPTASDLALDLGRAIKGESVKAERWVADKIVLFRREVIRSSDGSETVLKVPPSCRAEPGSGEESLTGTGYSREIVHEKTKVKLVFVPAGEFLMGSRLDPSEMARRWGGMESWYESEHPLHLVRVPRPFYMGKSPVTCEEYKHFVTATGRDSAKGPGPSLQNGSASSDSPATWISWRDAMAYCEWAGLRLPSEAQWEYACMAGGQGPWGRAETEDVLDRYAWTSRNSEKRLRAVAKKSPNPWGIHDLCGLVWEWCEDVWHDDYQDAPADGSSWKTGGDPQSRVLRGGSFQTTAPFCRATHRHADQETCSTDTYGFRVILPL